MARTPSGLEVIEQARKQLREAQGIAELKSAHAVVFPLDFGLSMEETSKAIGLSKGGACQLRRHFIAQHSLPDVGANVPTSRPEKVRNRAYMKSCEEREFLGQFTEKAAEAGICVSVKSVKH